MARSGASEPRRPRRVPIMAKVRASEAVRAARHLAPAPAPCYSAWMTDPIATEERIAHLARAVDDLSEIVARQDRAIAGLSRRVELLMQREAEREAELGTAPLADRRPPHW